MATDKIYPSKKGLIIYLPLLLLLIMEGVYIATQAYITGVLMLVIVSAVFLPIFLNTRYTLTTNGALKIKSGYFINLIVPVSSIKKVVPTKTLWSAPALSLDRMEIFYNKFDSVIISPENKMDFMAQLQSINPAIEYQNK